MRVLIVNAHTHTSEAQKAFQDLLAIVKEVLRYSILRSSDYSIIYLKNDLLKIVSETVQRRSYRIG